MLFESSEEDNNKRKGLGVISGKVVKLPNSKNYRIPRIGWAQSKIIKDFLGLKKDDLIDFYYIHSFHVQPENPNTIHIESDNGIVSAIKFQNIYGCQFHPEKSHNKGLTILKHFIDL